MQLIKNIQLKGADNRPFLLDVYYHNDTIAKPVIVFTHGFKGFKDWGHWHLIAKAFSEAGFVFITYNISHNGTTIEAPSDFDDLEAFGQNNFSKELEDLKVVLDWLSGADCEIPNGEYDKLRMGLIGHSRGGALNVIKANEDDRVKALITWASVSQLDYAWKDAKQIEDWGNKGVYHIYNGRTKQEMPLYYQIFKDFKDKQDRFDTTKALFAHSKPYLIVHGSADPAVPPQSAVDLHSWARNSQLQIIDEADHVFNGRHPFEGIELPKASKKLIEVSISFLKENL
jgi:dienelactone hydrolase